jgi:transcriptional regulator with XRE-family HTH domain
MLRMKVERPRRGWTQTVLAYRARTSAPEVSRIETGRTRPYPRQLARLAKALGLTPSDVLEEVEVAQSDTNTHQGNG